MHGLVERVELARPVQRDDAIARAPLDQDRCVFHGRLLVNFDDRIRPRHGSAAHRRNRLPTAVAPPAMRGLVVGSSATFWRSARSWPIASWSGDYKRNWHATADKHIWEDRK